MKSATYDFLFPTHVVYHDMSAWPPLTVQFKDAPLLIHKPIRDVSNHPVPASIGNQTLDVYSTVIRLELRSDTPPDGWKLYPFAIGCLTWIRVLTRQYWVGFAGSGSNTVRGSSVITELQTGEALPTNFGGFKLPIITEPLAQQTWAEVGQALAAEQYPRTSDLILCNGLLAVRDGNLREAIALLGIACESELNECIQFLLSVRKDDVTELLYERTRPDFKWKLNKLLPALCQRKFSEDEPHWSSELVQLYDARGTAAHSALLPDMVSKVPCFVLAADSFLRWIHGIRSAHGDSLGPCPLSIPSTIGGA